MPFEICFFGKMKYITLHRTELPWPIYCIMYNKYAVFFCGTNLFLCIIIINQEARMCFRRKVTAYNRKEVAPHLREWTGEMFACGRLPFVHTSFLLSINSPLSWPLPECTCSICPLNSPPGDCAESLWEPQIDIETKTSSWL